MDPKNFNKVFAGDLRKAEADKLRGEQIPTSPTIFDAPAVKAAWHDKPTFYAVSGRDLMLSPKAQEVFASRIKARLGVLEVLVVQRKLADLDDREGQRGRRQLGEGMGHLPVERLPPQAADEDRDVALIGHGRTLGDPSALRNDRRLLSHLMSHVWNDDLPGHPAERGRDARNARCRAGPRDTPTHRERE